MTVLEKVGRTWVSMSESRQELLRKTWLGGRQGNLSPMMQAKAWALREVWQDQEESSYGMLEHIAGKLAKVGPEGSQPEQPTKQAMDKLFQKMDADPDWYPGKSTQEKHGPSPVVNATNQAIVARSAMAMKSRGEEPTYGVLVAANPNALANAGTMVPVDKKIVYKILRKRCHDNVDDPDDTWTNQVRLSQNALTDGQKVERHTWALGFQENDITRKRRTANWFFHNVVWTDICNTILPRTKKRHEEMILARKGKKGWMSSKTKRASKNLKGNASKLKQKSWDSIKVWWAPILTRGKLHIEMMGEGFPGETVGGAAILAHKVRTALNVRFRGDDKPSIVFVDRGRGFFFPNGGRIVPEFKAALEEAELKAYYGDNAKAQPGNMQDVLLHETSVSWIRHRETRCRPTTPWQETPADLGVRLRSICQDINDKLDVEGLCKGWPKRVQEVVNAQGDRIKH